ncbi:shikimate 5-dehydrogenase, partial [mine drainage metagenome]
AHNTDYIGFLKTLEINSLNPDGKKICLAGTGGVFRTILFAIVSNFSPSSITVLSRDPEGKKLRFEGFDYMENVSIERYDIEGEFDLIINCTPLGINVSDPSPVSEKIMTDETTAIDLTYSVKTQFIEKVEKKGGTGINGREMFFQQARESYLLFHGEYPENEKFEKIRRKIEDVS